MRLTVTKGLRDKTKSTNPFSGSARKRFIKPEIESGQAGGENNNPSIN